MAGGFCPFLRSLAIRSVTLTFAWLDSGLLGVNVEVRILWIGGARSLTEGEVNCFTVVRCLCQMLERESCEMERWLDSVGEVDLLVFDKIRFLKAGGKLNLVFVKTFGTVFFFVAIYLNSSYVWLYNEARHFEYSR